MKKAILASILFCGFCTATQAGLMNGSFEEGLSSWSSAGGLVTTRVLESSFTGNSYHPTDGAQFAVLTAGAPVTLLKTVFQAEPGDTIRFDWAFLAFDYLPYNDYGAWVLGAVIDGFTYEAAILANILDVGDFGETGWMSTAFTLPASHAGPVQIGFTATNVQDGLLHSKLLVDNVHVTAAAVPEPGVLGLFGLGFIGLGFSLRGRKRKAVR